MNNFQNALEKIETKIIDNKVSRDVCFFFFWFVEKRYDRSFIRAALFKAFLYLHGAELLS